MRHSSWQCHSSCFCCLYESGTGVRLRRCLYEFSFGHCWAWGGGASVEILSEANLFIQTNCKCNSILLVIATIVSSYRSSLCFDVSLPSGKSGPPPWISTQPTLTPNCHKILHLWRVILRRKYIINATQQRGYQRPNTSLIIVMGDIIVAIIMIRSAMEQSSSSQPSSSSPPETRRGAPVLSRPRLGDYDTLLSSSL